MKETDLVKIKTLLESAGIAYEDDGFFNELFIVKDKYTIVFVFTDQDKLYDVELFKK